LALLLLLAVVLASGLTARRVEGQGAGELLAEGVGARERTLAGGTAIAQPAVALSWNPARLAAASRLVAGAYFAPLPEGASHDQVGVAWPVGPGVLGAGIARIGVGDIATFDSGGIPTGAASFSDVELATGYALGLAWPGSPSPASSGLAPSLDLGVAIRLRRQSFGGLSGSGLGLDLGVAVRPRPGLEFGVRARNLIAPSLTLASDVERLPRSFTVGAAITRSLRGRPLLVAAETAVGEVEAPLALGFELPLAHSFLGRAGLRGGDPRLGLGFNAGFVDVDYGIETHALGLVHTISISARIGDDAAEQRAREEAASAVERETLAQAAVEEAIARSVADLRARARAAESPEEARGAWLALLAQRPDDAEAGSALAEIAARTNAAERDSLMAGESARAAEIARLSALAEQREGEGALADASSLWGQVLALAPDDPAAASGLTRMRDRLAAAADSLAVTRRDLGARETDLAQRKREIDRLSLLVRALEAHAAGEEVRAAATLDSVIARYPDDPAAQALATRAAPSTAFDDPEVRDQARRLYIAGMRHFNASDYEGAIRYWEELLALDPQNSAVRLNLDEARARLGVEK
jgi:tetratricopeptide (TPR) repeat protein